MFSYIILGGISGYIAEERFRDLFRFVPPRIEPGDWPPNCPECGKFAAIFAGALSYFAISALFPTDINATTIMAAGFLAGRLGGKIGSALGGQLKKKTA